MAAGAFTILNSAKLKLWKAVFNTDTHTFKVALLTAAVPLTAASTIDTYAEITSQVVGTGYTATGKALTGVTVTESTGTVKFDADDVVWTTATIDAKWAVVYSDTATSKDILGFIDLNNASGSAVLSSTGADFTINWNASGIVTVA